MEPLVFATKNKKKGNEIKEKFYREQIPVEIVEVDFSEPEVNDIEVVSKSKAIQAYQLVGRPCFVIDSGFSIYHYPNNPGYPGAFARRSGISTDVSGLLNIMKDVKERGCEFTDCLTFYDGDEFYYFYGRDVGTLTYKKRGNDCKTARSDLWFVFQPLNYDKTLAEMTEEERMNRKDGHVSAKSQFIEWYKKEYKNTPHLIKNLQF